MTGVPFTDKRLAVLLSVAPVNNPPGTVTATFVVTEAPVPSDAMVIRPVPTLAVTPAAAVNVKPVRPTPTIALNGSEMTTFSNGAPVVFVAVTANVARNPFAAVGPLTSV